MENFSYEIDQHSQFGGVGVLKVTGFVYAPTMPDFDKALQAVYNKTTSKKIILDLSRAKYFSGQAWKALLVFHAHVRRMRGDIFLAAMPTEIHDTFEMLEFNKWVRLFPNVEKALSEGFGKQSPALSVKIS